jgi:hypothetical protein
LLIDPDYNPNPVLSGQFVRREISTSMGAATASALLAHLQSSGWELLEGAEYMRQSSAVIERPGFYFFTAIPPAPGETITPVQANGNPPWRVIGFNTSLFAAYDPLRETPGDIGDNVFWYEAGYTQFGTATALAQRISDTTEFNVVLTTTDPDAATFSFTVTPRDAEVAFELDDEPLGMGGTAHMGGGYRTLRSQYIIDGDVNEGGRIYIQVGTGYWSNVFGGGPFHPFLGTLTCFVTITAENGGSSYQHFVHAGTFKFAGGPHQFVLWGDTLPQPNNLLVSALKSEPRHRMGAAPILVVGTNNFDLTISHTQLRTKLYWSGAWASGLQTSMQSTRYGGGGIFVDSQPILMVRGCRGRAMVSRSGEPLAQAPYVVLSPGPYEATDGYLAGKLWDMIALSGYPGGGAPNPDRDRITYAGRKWDLLTVNMSGTQIHTTLWVRAN